MRCAALRKVFTSDVHTYVKRSLPLVIVQHKVRVSLLVFGFSFDRFSSGSESGEMSSKSADLGHQNGGLLLYYNRFSFYSQKVAMALYEKHLSFESRDINIAKYEQYQPWYLQINPKGEVPVLQDTGKIIPDSARIIDYLEDNFSNGDTPRLIPMDQGTEVKQKITHFRNLIDQVNGNHVTVGSFIHKEFVQSPKVPFIGPVRSKLLSEERSSSESLKKIAEANPNAKEMLLQKARNKEQTLATLENKEEFVKLLEKVEEILNTVEEELAKHTEDKSDWWLCSDRFTVADISLTILLERLYEVGLESRFWANGVRPNIEKYFKRVRERESYKKTIPGMGYLVKTVLMSQVPLFFGIGLAAAIALAFGGWD